MSPILRVLTWEYCRRASLPLLGIVVAGLVLPWILFRGVLDIPVIEFDSTNYYPAFMGLCGAMSLICSLDAQKGVRQRLYTRPVSTQFIFAWLMLTPIITAAIVHSSANLLARGLYGVQWPWIRPCLCLAVLVIVTQYFHWRLLYRSVYHTFAFLVGYALLLYGWSVCHLVDGRLVVQKPFSALELLTISALAVVFGGLAFRSLVRIRTDGELDMSQPCATDWAETKSTTAAKQKFASPEKALRWFAWRQAGSMAIPAALGVGLLAIGLLTLGITQPNRKIFELSLVGLFISCFGSGSVIGTAIYLCVRMPGETDSQVMSPFLSTRPVTVSTIWRTFGMTMFRSCLVAWLIAITVFSGGLLFASMDANNRSTISQEFDGLMMDWPAGWLGATMLLPFSFLVMWTAASVAASVMFFGRDRQVTLLFVFGVIAVVALAFIGLGLQPAAAERMSQISWLVAGSLAVCATAWAFAVAKRRDLLPQNEFILGLCVLLAIACATFLVSPWEIGSRLALAAFSTLTVFAIAAGPLGIAAARHR